MSADYLLGRTDIRTAATETILPKDFTPDTFAAKVVPELEGYSDVKPDIGFYKLKFISPAVLQQFMNERANRGFSRNYLVNILTVLSGSFKAAVFSYKFIRDNPMQYVKLPKNNNRKSNTNRKVISPDEFSTIIKRFPQGNTFYIPLQIAYHTGIRIGECCALTWDDVDLEAQTITVNKIILKKEKKQWYFGTTKTESSVRKIPIGNTLTNILKQHRKWQIENCLKYGLYYYRYYKSELDRVYGVDGLNEFKTTDQPVHFVCTAENGKLVTPKTVRYCSRVINYELLIQFNFHALRHTHATLLIENGTNMKDVQERLGHSRLSTTMDTYTHVTEKTSNNMVEIFEEICQRHEHQAGKS